MNFQRLKGTGVNLGVIIISIVVFFVALFVVMGLANAQKPDTMDILAAAQDFGVGHVLTPQDLVVKTVFVDDNTSLYIRADEEGTASLLNGNYPQGGSLFPLPLDLANVIAPSTDSFLPGDLVNITVVISSRPQPPVTPTVMPEFITGRIQLALLLQLLSCNCGGNLGHRPPVINGLWRSFDIARTIGKTEGVVVNDFAILHNDSR
jgi:hypothetical protein